MEQITDEEKEKLKILFAENHEIEFCRFEDLLCEKAENYNGLYHVRYCVNKDFTGFLKYCRNTFGDVLKIHIDDIDNGVIEIVCFDEKRNNKK